MLQLNKLRHGNCLSCVIQDHAPRFLCNHCNLGSCHHEIQSLCSVPYCCSFLLKQHSVFRSLSSTEIASTIIANFLFQDVFQTLPNLISFNRIGEFAWKQYENITIVFSVNVLKNADLFSSEINTFFNSKRESSSISLPSDQPASVFFTCFVTRDSCCCVASVKKQLKF